MGGPTMTDVIDENREFLEELAEREHLRISKYARKMLETRE